MLRLLTASLVLASLAFGCADSSFDPGDGGVGPGTDYGGIDPNRPSCPVTSASIKGVVYAPNGTDPVPGATVFVPATVPELFPPEVRCEVCGSLGNSYNFWTTVTGNDGSFSLDGVCPGEWTLVMQNGRFRRGITVKVQENTDVQLSAEQSRLPRKTAEKGPLDAIPRIAVATGDYDKMECVLHNMGLQDFDLYEGAQFLVQQNKLPPFGGLVQHLEDMKRYNIIFINCTNDTWEQALEDEAVRNNIDAYVKAGGRLYVTDWSYDWIEQIPSLSKFIDFEPGASDERPEEANAAILGEDGLEIDGIIKDDTMAQWLAIFPNTVSTSGAEPTVPIGHFLAQWVMINKLGADTKLWVEGNVRDHYNQITGIKPLTVTFNFNNCGKILYTSYHTEGRDAELELAEFGVPPDPFPAYCGSRLSPQDRILEFLIYDIAKCVKPIE